MTDAERIAAACYYLGITPEQAAALPARVLDVAAGEDTTPPPPWLQDILDTMIPRDVGEVVKYWRLLWVLGPAMTPAATPAGEGPR